MITLKNLDTGVEWVNIHKMSEVMDKKWGRCLKLEGPFHRKFEGEPTEAEYELQDGGKRFLFSGYVAIVDPNAGEARLCLSSDVEVEVVSS